MPQPIQQKRDTAAAWTAANSVLLPGQFGVETDTGKMKLGVAAGTAWNSLGYYASEVFANAAATTAAALRQAALVSGTNLKTINGSSLLGAGDLAVGNAVRDRFEKDFWYPPTWQGAAPTGVGLNTPTMLDSSTCSAVLPDRSSLYKSLPLTRITGPTAAISRLAGMTFSKFCYFRASALPANWKQRVAIIGSIADANAAGQFGMGIHFNAPAWTSSAGTNVQPSAMILSLFLGADETDGNIALFSSDATGPCLKTAMASLAPANSNAADPLELQATLRIISSVPTVDYTAKNLITGVTLTGTLSAAVDLPENAIAQLGAFLCRGSANGVVAPACDFGGLRGGNHCDF